MIFLKPVLGNILHLHHVPDAEFSTPAARLINPAEENSASRRRRSVPRSRPLTSGLPVINLQFTPGLLEIFVYIEDAMGKLVQQRIRSVMAKCRNARPRMPLPRSSALALGVVNLINTTLLQSDVQKGKQRLSRHRSDQKAALSNDHL